MQRKELLAIVERLCDVELDTLERDDLAEIVASAARIRGWLDATELRCTRRARSLADAGRAESAPSLIANNGNRSNRDADQVDRRDKVAEAMPSFEDGLDHATVSAGHLDAIANATRNAPPDVRAAFAAHDVELVALAAADSVEMFAGAAARSSPSSPPTSPATTPPSSTANATRRQSVSGSMPTTDSTTRTSPSTRSATKSSGTRSTGTCGAANNATAMPAPRGTRCRSTH